MLNPIKENSTDCPVDEAEVVLSEGCINLYPKILKKPFLKALKRSRNQKVVIRKRAMRSHGCHQAFEQENRKKRSSPGPRSRGNVLKFLIDLFKLESNKFFAGG